MSEEKIDVTFSQFVETIARLRSGDGCPWDRAQTHSTIARNMIEEAHEAVDAIERRDTQDLREELGDVLLQVVLQSQIAKEAGTFDISDVISGVNDKMIRRHPHVFGDEAAFAAAHLTAEQVEQIRKTATPGQVLDLWDQIKLIEKKQKAEAKAKSDNVPWQRSIVSEEPSRSDLMEGEPSVESLMGTEPSPEDLLPSSPVQERLLEGIPQSLPALMQAQDISRKVVAAGFEWPDVASVWDQVNSEMEEYQAEDKGSERAEEEFGDLLFSLINVARKEGIDAESALRRSCRKFRARWAIMEDEAQRAKKHISTYTLDELEALWSNAKLQTKQQGQRNL